MWFNKDIEIDNKPFNFQDILIENTNFIEHLCKLSGIFKSWSEIKTEYNLEGKMFYNWFQLLVKIVKIKKPRQGYNLLRNRRELDVYKKKIFIHKKYFAV